MLTTKSPVPVRNASEPVAPEIQIWVLFGPVGALEDGAVQVERLVTEQRLVLTPKQRVAVWVAAVSTATIALKGVIVLIRDWPGTGG